MHFYFRYSCFCRELPYLDFQVYTEAVLFSETAEHGASENRTELHLTESHTNSTDDLHGLKLLFSFLNNFNAHFSTSILAYGECILCHNQSLIRAERCIF